MNSFTYKFLRTTSSVTPNQYTSTNRCVFSSIKFLFLRLSFLLFTMLLTSSPSSSSTREMSMYVTICMNNYVDKTTKGEFFSLLYMNNYTQLLIIHAENKKSLMSLLNPCARDRQISIYQLQLIPV